MPNSAAPPCETSVGADLDLGRCGLRAVGGGGAPGLLYAAGQAGVLGGVPGAGLGAVVVDAALGRLAEGSLLAFTLDGQVVTAHRLVLLEARVGALAGSADRVAVRDVPEQVTALQQAAAGLAGEAGELEMALLNLRLWALYHLSNLGDSAAQATAVGEPLAENLGRLLGPDHPETLASRNNLALAYQEAGRVGGAIPLHERTLADRERVLGADHPRTLVSRSNLANAYQEAGRGANAPSRRRWWDLRRRPSP